MKRLAIVDADTWQAAVKAHCTGEFHLGETHGVDLPNGQVVVVINHENQLPAGFDMLPAAVNPAPLAKAHVQALAGFGVTDGDGTVQAMLKLGKQHPLFNP